MRAAFLQYPTEHGFGTELWTLKRVGVPHRAPVRRPVRPDPDLAHPGLAWASAPQKPEQRAIERDDDAVRQWKRSTWPRLKKKPSAKAA